MLTTVLLLVAVLGEVTGTLALRQSRGLRRPGWAVLVLGSYVIAFTCLGLTLQRGLPVGIAYGVWASVGIALTALAGRALFDEPLTRGMVLGLAVILGGVALVEVGAG